MSDPSPSTATGASAPASDPAQFASDNNKTGPSTSPGSEIGESSEMVEFAMLMTKASTSDGTCGCRSPR